MFQRKSEKIPFYAYFYYYCIDYDGQLPTARIQLQ